jgi:hypothetical protein
MNLKSLTFAAAVWLGITGGRAQNVVQPPQEDPVQEAIREFNQNRSGKPNEVTVVLDPVGQPPAPPADHQESPPATSLPSGEPVLVTGKPPENSTLVEEKDEGADPPAEPAAEIPEEPAPKPPKGLGVRVEKLQSGTGSIDPSQVKLRAPFPAKPITPAPAGWRLEAADHAPPFTREVELSPGKKITLTVRPHVLVPDADGSLVFNVSEPGFDASRGFQQINTVTAILSNSINGLEQDSKNLGSTIDSLQQLLASLPKTETRAETKPEIKPTPIRKK